MNSIEFFAYSFALAGSVFIGEQMYLNHQYNEKFKHEIVSTELDSQFVSRVAYVRQITQCARSVDCSVMAEAIYFEGRGEKQKGQIAIAQVVKRRAQATSKTIKQVVYQRNSEGVCQFSYVCDIRAKRISSHKADKTSWNNAMIYAYGVLVNRYPDYSKGADHYFNPRKVKEQPYWAKKMIQVSSIDNHVFYSSGYTKAL